MPAGSDPKCQYVCNEGFEPSGNTCVPIVCKGAPIANANLCEGDDIGLKLSASYTLADSCSEPVGSAPKCQFICKDGYTRNGNVCIAAPDLVVNGPTEYEVDISSPVSISASVRNSGVVASSATTYLVKVDNTILETGSVPALSRGGTFQLRTKDWPGALGTSIHPFVVEVVPSRGERDTTDNRMNGNILVTCLEDDSCVAKTCTSDTCVTKCGNERKGRKDCSYKEVTP
jgi:hypothetical protein